MFGSPGEFMMNAAATKAIGADALAYMNETGKIPGYADGGIITGPSLESLGSGRLLNATSPLAGRRMEKVGGSSGEAPVVLNMNVYAQDAQSFRKSQGQILGEANAMLARGRRNT
jgi:hypothetical protein